MFNSVSYELMMSKLGTLPSGQWKGSVATAADLPAVGALADYAYVTATSSFWAWNPAVGTGGEWVNLQIAESDYLELDDSAKSTVNYLVVPDPAP